MLSERAKDLLAALQQRISVQGAFLALFAFVDESPNGRFGWLAFGEQAVSGVDYHRQIVVWQKKIRESIQEEVEVDWIHEIAKVGDSLSEISAREEISREASLSLVIALKVLDSAFRGVHPGEVSHAADGPGYISFRTRVRSGLPLFETDSRQVFPRPRRLSQPEIRGQGRLNELLENLVVIPRSALLRVVNLTAFTVDSPTASNKVFSVADSPLVSPYDAERLRYFRSLVGQFGLGESEVREWLARVSSSPLDSFGVSDLERDFRDSPRGRSTRISEQLRSGSVSVADMVPTSRKYFERLVPAWKGQATVLDFAADVPRIDISQWALMERLTWSSHSAIALNLGLLELSAVSIEGQFAASLEELDLWSLVGLIENLASHKDGLADLVGVTTEALERFSRLIEDPVRLELTVALVGMIDGSVNAAGILRDTPVYWRRLATISHAAILERSVIQSSLDLGSFTSWAAGSWPLFQAVSIVDLRSEPRWAAFMLNPGQLRQEFIGRVLNAFYTRQSEMAGTELHSLVFGDDDQSLQSRRNVFYSGLPGPLEGGESTALPLTEHLEHLIQQALDDDSLPLARRVMAAAQISALGAPSPEVLRRLTDSTAKLGSEVLIPGDEDVTTTLLTWLAVAAASYRSGELASTIQYLALENDGLSVHFRLQVGLMACASEADRGDWRVAVARVLARCASIARGQKDIEYVLFVLRAICDAHPEIKPQVARTYASLLGAAKRTI